MFPFGTEPFSRLREQFWMSVCDKAARHDRSLIFTFASEPTVSEAFPEQVRAAVEAQGGAVLFVALTLAYEEQERRLVEEGRAASGKMRDPSLLRGLQPRFAGCMTAMPRPSLNLDTGASTPVESAEAILRLMSGQT